MFWSVLLIWATYTAIFWNEGEREPIEGRLTYRGYNVYDLIHGLEQENRFGFEEIGYLLMCGKLPSRRQLAEFQHTIGLERALPDNFTEDMIMRAPSRDIMNKLASATLALYSYDANPDETTVENIMRQGISLMAKFPVIISHAYQAKRRYFDNDSMFLHVPDPNRSTAENILHLIRPTGEFNDDEAKLLDRCLILHAEHGGGNNSSFTVRVTSSSGTDTYSAIAAAVSSLKGPRHGGANLRVVKQFEEMKENIHNWKDETEVGNYLRKILNKEAGDGSGLIYGMGHAIYTLSDPRAVALKKAARPLAEKTGYSDEMDLIELVEKLTPGVFAEIKAATSRCAQTSICIPALFTKCSDCPSRCIRRCSLPRVSSAGWHTALRKLPPAVRSSVRRISLLRRISSTLILMSGMTVRSTTDF